MLIFRFTLYISNSSHVFYVPIRTGLYVVIKKNHIIFLILVIVSYRCFKLSASCISTVNITTTVTSEQKLCHMIEKESDPYQPQPHCPAGH